MRILTLVSPAAFIRLLAGVGSLDAEVVKARSWKQLVELIHRDPTGIVVVDPYWNQSATAHDLSELHKRAPLVPLVLYTTPHPIVGKLLPALYRFGVRDCLFLGDGDGKARISRALAAAGRSSIPEQILMRLAPVIDALAPEQRQTVRRLLQDAAGAPTVVKLAEACGLSPRHLLRLCTEAGLPAPSELLVSARCAHALIALSNAGTTVAEAAEHAGISRQALHRRTRAALQTTPRKAVRTMVAQARTRVRNVSQGKSDSPKNILSAWTDQLRDADA